MRSAAAPATRGAAKDVPVTASYPASALRSHDPDARRCEIRLLGMVDSGVPAAGKRGIDPGPAVVGADSERTERRGRDRERRLRRRFEKSRILPECGG